MNKILLLITTVSKRELAKKIAALLIKKKLAACISLKEINSIYIWEDVVEDCQEIEITIKSTPENLNLLIKTLKKEISYDVPQFIYKIFEAEINYYDWIKKSVIS